MEGCGTCGCLTVLAGFARHHTEFRYGVYLYPLRVQCVQVQVQGLDFSSKKRKPAHRCSVLLYLEQDTKPVFAAL